MNYENLQIVIEGLKGLNINSYQFSMANFRLNEHLEPINFYSQKDCGTVGCFVGWLPFIKGLEPIQSDFISDSNFNHSLVFHDYFYRIMDIKPNSDKAGVIKSFLTSSVWAMTKQNTLQDAIYRAEILLKHRDELINKLKGLPVRKRLFKKINQRCMEDVVNEYKNLENNIK